MIKTLYRVVMTRFYMGEMMHDFSNREKANDFAKLHGLRSFWQVTFESSNDSEWLEVAVQE